MVPPDVDARAREYEAMIRRIKDVISARVMFSPDGQVEEIHVLASGSRNAKQLVRDVESLLMAQGTTVDHKKISIALLAPEAGASEDERIRIVGFSVSRQGKTVEARVRVEYRGAGAEGIAQGPGTGNGRIRAIAEATLSAVQRFIKVSSVLFLDDCGVVQIGTKHAAAVCVLELDGDVEQTYIGACLVKQDELDAVVRATLDAVNRRFSLWAVTQRVNPTI
jgi:hypothetical protein